MYAIHTYLLSASCLFSACYGATLPVEHGNVRLRANAQPPVRESVLLDHLQATIGLSPVRTENLGNNKYQEYFVIEPSDYESAFSSLLAVGNATLAETEFSKGVLGPAALEKRDILYSALCYDSGTLGYANVIGQIIPGICTGFSFGVGYAGKTQIARYYDLNDINGDRMVVVVRYTWHGVSWASSNACSSTILYYIDQYCTKTENNQRVVQGGQVVAEQTNNCDSSPCQDRGEAGVDPNVS